MNKEEINKPGWLKEILDQASKEVYSWPEWKRSSHFNLELEKIKKSKIVK